MASNLDDTSRPISKEAKLIKKITYKEEKLNQTTSTQNLEAFGFL